MKPAVPLAIENAEEKRNDDRNVPMIGRRHRRAGSLNGAGEAA